MTMMTKMMMNSRFDTETINALIEEQLASWPLAKENFFALGMAERRPLGLGALEGAAQCNPARIVSTGAAVDKRSIAARPCFLCRKNRPEEQHTIEWLPCWELLVNPYPILPVHFTVAAREHTPQDRVPADMVTMAELAPSLCFFFNGTRAGASAPDHLHVQAVLRSELPLLRLAETLHRDAGDMPVMRSDLCGIDLPFHFLSAIVTPDENGMKTLRAMLGIGGGEGLRDKGLVNFFCWIDDGGRLRIVAVPRRAHRPSCYYAEGEERMMVSPGAIDMAGLMILPRREDFDRMDEATARRIYAEVAYADNLPI